MDATTGRWKYFSVIPVNPRSGVRRAEAGKSERREGVGEGEGEAVRAREPERGRDWRGEAVGKRILERGPPIFLS
jgi:hypothetical protein